MDGRRGEARDAGRRQRTSSGSPLNSWKQIPGESVSETAAGKKVDSCRQARSINEPALFLRP